MRRLLPLLFVGLSTCAHADKLITIPTGSKITLNTVKFEGLLEQSRNRNSRYYIGTGITDAIDAHITGEIFDGRRMRTSFDVSYNYIPAITGIGPGISIGLVDALGVTRDGRRFFLAITNKEGFTDSTGGTVPAEFTFGGYFGSYSSPFVGVALPFTDYVKFMAEYTGRRINAGVEFRPIKEIGLRATFERRDVLLGAQITIKF